jgi:prophage endopeptidase
MKYVIAIVLFCSFVGGVYEYGHHQGYAESQAEVAAQVAKANEQARATEQKLNDQVADLSTKLKKVQNDAQKQIAQRDADILANKLQLYVHTKAPVCPSKDAAPTSGSDTTTAQLDPAFAQSLVAVTDDGDLAIRKLNACIATYNQVKEMINGR